VAPEHWRVSLDVAHGAFLTSHVADEGDHRHHVRLGITHGELSAEYGLRENVQFEVRLPYDVKAQRVSYTTLDGAPFVPPYGDIHHRTETLTGFSDASVGFDYAPSPQWLFGVGTTIPLGNTVPDPIVLGREGKKHEHLQFGSGTFEPKLLAQWQRRNLFARGEARLSLYENSRGYRAPSTFSWSSGASFRPAAVSITPSLTGQIQTLGRWSGVPDEGAGFRSAGVRLQLSAPLRGVFIAPGVYRELWSRGVNREAGETFHQGTTWSLSLTRVF
jgi:hypothetical protein